ncbi:hypothetical protein FGO68_gene10178 [Halteria grandinella]|uniref:Uncharacterized protein n=1 Tax=Halteria grandinella TaxID=5974 RepID=A0A8J8NZQ3_HALGN|nr:hypothetical protein FGO68_gene10178 [Halteria grandinella]
MRGQQQQVQQPPAADGGTGGSKKGFMQSFNDSQRCKPQFQEQFRHANNESDVSIEDGEDLAADVDENLVRAHKKQPVAEKGQQMRDLSGARSLLKQPGFLQQQQQQFSQRKPSVEIATASAARAISANRPSQTNSVLPQTLMRNMNNNQPPPEEQQLPPASTGEEHDPERETDFNKAYSKLVKKFYYQQEQGANILIPEEDLMRVEEEEHYSQSTKGFDPNEVQRRIEEQQRKKEEKLEQMRRDKEAKELEGCTFAPQIKSQPRRDVNKFLEDQKRYLEEKEKRAKMRQERQLAEEQQQVSGSVSAVNEKSRRILEEKLRKAQMPAQQPKQEETPDQQQLPRPQTAKKEFLQKGKAANKAAVERKRSPAAPKEEAFQPQISKKSQKLAEVKRQGQKIEDHLLLEGRKLKEKLAKMEEIDKKHSVKKITNDNSEKYIAQKFLREFDRTIHDMFTLEGQPQQIGNLDELRLNYIRFKELLMRLGLISELTNHTTSANIDSQESVLIIELWKLLKSKQVQEDEEGKQEDVRIKDAKVATMAILRIQHHQPSTLPPSDEQYGRHLAGNFTFADGDIPRIQKRFNLFYLNRLQFQGRLLDEAKQQKSLQQEFVYKPHLNENSSAIAARYRQKLVDGASVAGGEDHQEVNPLTWLTETHYKQVWREQASKIINDERMRECTFQPQRITVNARKRDAGDGASGAGTAGSVATGGKRYQALYAMAKGHQQKDKTDKSKEDYEFEKNKGELTFKPKFATRGAAASSMDANLQLSHEKQIQKQKERFERIKEERERARLLGERGTVITSGGLVYNPQGMGSANKNYRPPATAQKKQGSPEQIIAYPHQSLQIGESPDKHESLRQPQSHQVLAQSSVEEEHQLQEQLLSQLDHEDFLDEQQEDQHSENARLPLLYVDVNLGGIDGAQPERIVVFEGDTAQELAREFCDRHNLDDETQIRLEQLLTQQINSVLTKIREEEDDATGGGAEGEESEESDKNGGGYQSDEI